ncbi:two component transcriptional regulator, winged helix family [Paenibacillus curdlanolyticus YK9]|uniref:Two component transcriptional regulator, winged helix family n=1 Tax=Paenibacillus curdlanolyticus YK9 TaxID=717606 RepID=E0IF25_9BACL|nr:response regulator transcription factor [Paenibacillus curdlanolyticus]EFM08801.1 two component transcriptional regulator, winged helix family [Paenibacillus curdlanolyticus YK9]
MNVKTFAQKVVRSLREKIIVIDDNREVCHHVARYLTRHGFEVICETYSNPVLSNVFHQHKADLLLLDLKQPHLAGIELCEELRKSTDTPLLFISSHHEDQLKIQALTSGGDDIITRPFNQDVLLARIRAHIRRNKRAFPTHQQHLLVLPDLEIDLLSQRVLVSGSEVSLSSKEFGLLAVLVKNPNRIYSVESLYELIWTESRMSSLQTVMVHIYNLRRKIEADPHKPRYIHTVRGAGYKFQFEP